MNRRTFLLSLAASPFLVEMLTACNPINSLPGGGGSGTKGLVRSDRARVPGSTPTLAADATNRFGAALLSKLEDGKPDNNLVCSPLSIAVALAMTVAGAGGDTRDEMATVLGYNSEADGSVDDFFAEYFPSMNSLLASLAERTESRRGVELDIANAVWGQAGEDWNAAFLDLLAEQFGTGVETVDFKADPDGALSTINGWVKQQTQDRIPELLSEKAIDDLTRLVLVNALYLKADWLTTFDPNDTSDGDFTTATGTTVQAPMMYRGDDIMHAIGDGWKAVELPYVFGELRMVAVVTDSATVTTPTIDDVVSQLAIGPVLLSFPRFDFETRLSLMNTLTQMGMRTAFTEAANFSGMTDSEPLKIDGVIHQANITTGENGTEAAAATAVEMDVAMASAPTDEVEPVRIRFDRPFTFWLRDEPTGVVIFAGRVNDPSQR